MVAPNGVLWEKIESSRYRHMVDMVGVDGQLTLLRAKAAVIGAGRLGSTVAEMLARIGVGQIKMVDGASLLSRSPDKRSVHCPLKNGWNKAEVAAERVAGINSGVTVQAVPVMIAKDNAAAVLSGMDVIISALTAGPSRLLTARAARRLTIPLVHVAADGWSGQVTTIYPGDVGLHCLYHPEGVGLYEHARSGRRAAAAALAAALAVQEVIKVLTGRGEAIRNRMLSFDIAAASFKFLPLEQEDSLFIQEAEYLGNR
jgi:molybdopterin/thiamine biosynthesis adenylyltransferase